MNGNIGNMGDMGSMIAKMLEDPEALGRVMSLAGTLSSSGLLGGLSLGDNAQEGSAPEQKSFQETNSNVNDSSKYEVKKTAPNLFESNTQKNHENHENHGHSPRRIKSSDRIRLLEAMRPFLTEEKRDKLDVVIKIIGLADAAGGLYSKR
jgi:hypothetical protein